MFEPIRGGTRGGQGEFKWSDVSADKDREVCITCSLHSYWGLTTHSELSRPQYQRTHWSMAEEQGYPLV
jgi:hypothetical protein